MNFFGIILVFKILEQYKRIITMKKVSLLSVSVFVLCTSFLLSQDQTNVIPNTAYMPGENLKYILYYGFINGGKAEINLRHVPTNNGTKIYHAKAEAKTIGMARMFIAIDDVYESYFNEQTCKPVKAIRNIKENDYRYYDEVHYDHANNKVTSKKNGVVKVPANMFDVISSLYYLRRTKFKNIKFNDTIKVMTYFADEIFPYRIIFKGRETVETPLGKIKALKFQPIVETGRVFKEQDDMRFWISDDANYLPLRVEFDMFVGSIKCDLIEYKNVKNPLAIVK